MNDRKHNVRLGENALIHSGFKRNSGMGYKALSGTGDYNCCIGWDAGFTSCDGDYIPECPADYKVNNAQDADQWCAYCDRLILKGNTVCEGCGAPLTRGDR